MTDFTRGIDSAFQQAEQQEIDDKTQAAKSDFLSLVQYDQYVGEVYSLGYETALVMIHDHHRREVGGIPSLSFLIATRIPRTVLDEAQATNLDGFDYTKEDFAKNGKHYDLIFDTSAYHKLGEYKNSLTSTGKFVVVGGSVNTILKTALFGSLITLGSQKEMKVLVHAPNKNLSLISDLVAEGKLNTAIDSVYTLKDTPKAYQLLGNGDVKGKVVIEINY